MSLRDTLLASKPCNGRFQRQDARMQMSQGVPQGCKCKYEDYTGMNMKNAAILSMDESVTIQILSYVRLSYM